MKFNFYYPASSIFKNYIMIIVLISLSLFLNQVVPCFNFFKKYLLHYHVHNEKMYIWMYIMCKCDWA